MLSYLLTGQVAAARFLWKRLPPEIRSDGEVALLWDVGKHMWQKQPARVQQTLRGATWAHPMIGALAAKLQQESLDASFKALGAAYNLIPVSVAAERLGASPGWPGWNLGCTGEATIHHKLPPPFLAHKSHHPHTRCTTV